MADSQEIRNAFSRSIGGAAWGLNRSHGSMFFLEIGEPIKRVGQVKSHGQWHFLVEECHWRFEKQGAVLVGSEDDQVFIDSVFESIELGSLIRSELLHPSNDLQIDFSNGIRFRTFSTSAKATDQWNQWIFFGPEGYSWVSDGGGNIKCEQDEPAG
jgi:hypothetical protein